MNHFAAKARTGIPESIPKTQNHAFAANVGDYSVGPKTGENYGKQRFFRFVEALMHVGRLAIACKKIPREL